MIGIDKLWPTFLKHQDYNLLKDNDFEVLWKRDIKKYNIDFFVSWGDSSGFSPECFIETGFFERSFHIDCHGLYENSSMGNLLNRECILYDAPKSWKDLFLKPKFGQPKSSEKWKGVVLAAQYPNDRSVLRAGGSKKYYEFIESACQFYGKKLLIKNHPVMIKNKEHNEIIESFCSKYGSEFGHFGHSIISDCDFVLVFNSTFVIDAIMNYKPVVQYAKGYFWESDCVFFSNGTFPTYFDGAKREFIDKMLDFLIWKYCIHYNEPIENVRKIISLFGGKNGNFPLREEFSYANFLLNGLRY